MQKKERKNTLKPNAQEERKLIVAAAKRASATAVRISTALELPIQLVQGDAIVEQRADGTIVELKKVQKVKSKIHFAKGTKICLQPKD